MHTHREGHAHSNTHLFDLSEFLEIDDTADCATETADAADAVLENLSGACVPMVVVQCENDIIETYRGGGDERERIVLL